MDIETHSPLCASDNMAAKPPINMTSNSWLETQGQANSFVVLLPTILFMLFCGWYIVHFAKRAAAFDAGFLLCTQMILCILAVYTELVGYYVLSTFNGAVVVLGFACYIGKIVGEWMLKTGEVELRTPTILTIGLFTSTLWDLLKVGACTRKGQFSYAESVFFVSAALKLSLITLADLSVRFMATDTTIRTHAMKRRVGSSKAFARILVWWLDSRAFEILKNLLRVDVLPNFELELLPNTFGEAFLNKYRENWRTNVLSDAPSRYFAMFWRELFMLAVPSLLLSACMAAIIVVPFRVIALSAWGWETDIALHCLCATVSWAASMGLSMVWRKFTDRTMNLLQDSHQRLIDEANEVLESMGPRNSARRRKAKDEQQELEKLLEGQKRLEVAILQIENDWKWGCRGCTVLLVVSYLVNALDMELSIGDFLIQSLTDRLMSWWKY